MSKVIIGKHRGYKRERIVLIKNNERFVECGLSAMRDPATGAILSSEPIYIKEANVKTASGFTPGEEKMLNGIANIFAEKYKEYLDGEKANAQMLIDSESYRHEKLAKYIETHKQN